MKRFLPLLGCLACTLTANATALLNETFSYANGSLTTVSGGAWAAHSSVGLNPVQVTNNQIRLQGLTASAEDVNRALPGGPYTPESGAVLYAGFDVKFTALPLPSTAFSNNYFAHFSDGGPINFRGRIYPTLSNAAPGSFRVGIANNTNRQDQGGVVYWGSDLSLNTTYRLVMRFDVASGLNTMLWINPAVETDTHITAIDPLPAGVAPTNILAFAFRQNGGVGTNLIDNLRVGTDFVDALLAGNSPPTITAIANQSIAVNASTAALPFVVTDDSTPPASLTLDKVTSNPTLVTYDNIVLGGSDSNRTVTVTPEAGQQGQATISITATDTDGATSSNSFIVFVGRPSISDMTNQTTTAGTPTPAIPFVITDPEGDPLTLSSASSNTNAISTNNITISGTGSNRTVTLAPPTGAGGTSTITITVSDGYTSASDSFVLTVTPHLGTLTSLHFDTDGPLVSGYGWVHTSGAITDELLATNGSVLLTDAQAEDVALVLPGAPYTTNSAVTLFASFSVNFSALPTTNVNNYFCHFSDNGNNFRARVFATTNGAADGFFRLAIANTSNSPSADFPADLSLGVTYAVVVRYNVTTGISTLWINPSSETDFSVTATDAINTSSVSRFGLRQAAGIGTLRFDNLRIGGDFADVATYVRLLLGISNSVITLSWPADLTNFTAQGTPSFSPTAWTNLPAPTNNGAFNLISITNLGAAGFFRLISP
jgi:hypothetical protein